MLTYISDIEILWDWLGVPEVVFVVEWEQLSQLVKVSPLSCRLDAWLKLRYQVFQAAFHALLLLIVRQAREWIRRLLFLFHLVLDLKAFFLERLRSS